MTELSLEDFEYSGTTLASWGSYFTVRAPGMPATALAINSALAEAHNKYQEAYNLYNELMVFCSKLQSDYDAIRKRAYAIKYAELKELGGRLPAKEAIEALALADNEDAHELQHTLMIHEVTKDFFANNIKKIEKTMPLLERISFGVVQSDRMHYRSGEPTI